MDDPKIEREKRRIDGIFVDAGFQLRLKALRFQINIGNLDGKIEMSFLSKHNITGKTPKDFGHSGFFESYPLHQENGKCFLIGAYEALQKLIEYKDFGKFSKLCEEIPKIKRTIEKKIYIEKNFL